MLPIDDAILARKTVKLQVEPDDPLPANTDLRATLDELMSLAGWAPFHKPCDRSHRGDSRVVEPWRFHLLDAPACRELIPVVTEKAERPGRIPNMLAGADALIQATWLPDPPEDGEPAIDGSGAFVPTMTNQEHIAATAAAVQTFLLAATARGLTTYWSSGGFLRSPEMFDVMGIPAGQILLGSIFIFPNDYDGHTWSPGGMRVRRSEAPAWARWVDLPRD